MGNNWKVVPLGTLCSKVLTGGTPLTKNKEFYDNGSIPWLKTKEVNFNFITETENFISEKGLKGSSAKLVPINSVIVAMYGQGDTAGRVAINKIPVTTNQACCNLVIDPEKADYRFIYYYLKDSYVELVRRKTGSAQPNLNTGILKDFEVPDIELNIQNKVGELLESFDKKINLNQQTNQTLEQMAQTLFKSWFVDFDPVFDNLLAKVDFKLENLASDFPEVLLKRAQKRLLALDDKVKTALLSAISSSEVKSPEETSSEEASQTNIHQHFPSEFEHNEQLGWIPKGWQALDILSCSSKISKGSTPRKKDIEEATGDVCIPFIKVRDISSTGEINISKLDLIPSCVHEKQLKRSILEENDVLFSIAGTIGRVSLVSSELQGSNANQAVAFIRAKKIEVSLFLYEFLKTESIQNEVQSKVVQAVQANVSLGKLGEIALVIPPTKLLERWHESSFSYLLKSQSLLESNRNLVKLRDTLLPKLISGELQIPDIKASNEKTT